MILWLAELHRGYARSSTYAIESDVGEGSGWEDGDPDMGRRVRTVREWKG